MESNSGHAVNPKQYRRLNGKWQFVPVAKQNGKPDPKLVIVNGELVSSKHGTFYLDWREDGKSRTRRTGATPREAWLLQSGEIEPDESHVLTPRRERHTWGGWEVAVAATYFM